MVLYPYPQNKLRQYGEIFRTAEIDSTFYALPTQGTVLGWARNTPGEFVFSAKLPQIVTHKKGLDPDPDRGVDANLKRFLGAMKPVMEAIKLACVLVQLPGFLRCDHERLGSFLSLLPDDQRFAAEFRHSSWLRGRRSGSSPIIMWPTR
jgi:uncharacterized protein YecE (DUF72 family)